MNGSGATSFAMLRRTVNIEATRAYLLVGFGGQLFVRIYGRRTRYANRPATGYEHLNGILQRLQDLSQARAASWGLKLTPRYYKLREVKQKRNEKQPNQNLPWKRKPKKRR